jgi:alkanesulfonate monooxygenase SsuD/methylene tetrahydromethanopterin reductase-like flavin-dependent oxidoreductase (luciferase family)
MRRAVATALAFRGATAPNPPVGCCLLDAGGAILAAEAHRRAGTAHAEAAAIAACRAAGMLDRIHTVVVTLEPFDHHGEFYDFDGFGPGFSPYRDTIPVSIGGSSDEAFEIGGAKGDIFSFWGEPLADIRSQIERVNDIAARSGRTDRPRIWVTFRPIVAQTDALAWEKAADYVERIGRTFQEGTFHKRYLGKNPPQNVGSQRLLAFAEKQELYDRALWMKTAAATNAGGASTAVQPLTSTISRTRTGAAALIRRVFPVRRADRRASRTAVVGVRLDCPGEQ